MAEETQQADTAMPELLGDMDTLQRTEDAVPGSEPGLQGRLLLSSMRPRIPAEGQVGREARKRRGPQHVGPEMEGASARPVL